MFAAVFFLLLNCPSFPSLVFIYCFVNPGGWIPSWIVNLVAKVRPPAAVGEGSLTDVDWAWGAVRRKRRCSLMKQPMVDWLWRGLGSPTPGTEVGTKDQNLYLEYQLHATFPPRSRQNHCLEPLDIQGCLWMLYLLEGWGQHGLGDNEICSSLGKPPALFLCFLSVRSRDFSGMQITHGDHSVCFVRSYLQAGGLTSSQREWESTQTRVKHIMLWILVLLLTV